MQRAPEGFSVRTKLLLAVGISFVLASGAVVFVADHIMTAKANEQGEQLFAERLDSIFSLLQKKQELLAKTGMEVAYRDGFQEATRKELAARFYSEPHSSAYPFILDPQERVVLHPSLKIGDESMARIQVTLRQQFADQPEAAVNGDFRILFQGHFQDTFGRHRFFPF